MLNRILILFLIIVLNSTIIADQLVKGGAVGWISNANLTYAQYSYANACSTNSCCGVPSNTNGSGWQYARTGNAMVDFWFTLNDSSSRRIYIQTQLIDSLKANHCYYIEFYVNLFNDAQYANNNISLLINDTAVESYGLKPIYANPQIQQFGNPCISDTLNWVRVGGIYTAHGGEQFITIGNFTDDAHTDTLLVRSNGMYSAYNIDDVSVILLDSMQLKADAGRDTTIVKGDSVWIGSRLCGLQNVVWYDAGNNVIDTGVPGMWVKPTTNTFYVIEQNVCGQYSRDTVNITVAALPVVLLSYSLSPSFGGVGEAVSNQWQTSTEINTSYFNIQRSTDGITFYTIGKVNAKGASSYTFNDQSPLWGAGGLLYYRLEIVDKNGSKTYSDVKEVSIINYQLSSAPNPAKDYITVVGSNIKEVIISDISGRVLIKSTERKIDISGLVSGTYIAEIETLSGNHVTQKLIRL